MLSRTQAGPGRADKEQQEQVHQTMYRARQKNCSQVARIFQARPGRSGKQQQEQNSRNLGTVFLPGPVIVHPPYSAFGRFVQSQVFKCVLVARDKKKVERGAFSHFALKLESWMVRCINENKLGILQTGGGHLVEWYMLKMRIWLILSFLTTNCNCSYKLAFKSLAQFCGQTLPY